MNAEPANPLVGREELERAIEVLNEIIERNRADGPDGLANAFRECNVDPEAAKKIVAEYHAELPYGDPVSFSAGMIHGLGLGVLAYTMVADSYIIKVVTPEDEDKPEET